MIEFSWIAFLPLACFILYWLRATIDTDKGAMVEVIAVTLPLALAYLVAFAGNPQINTLELGVHLTRFVVFVFWATPTLVAARMSERLFRREQPLLTDMFRITTVTALGIFVVRQLEVDSRAVLVVVTATAMYVIGDLIAIDRHRRPFRVWVIAASLALAFLFLSGGAFFFGDVLASFQMADFVEKLLLGPLVAFGPMLIAPSLLHALIERWGHLGGLGARLQAQQLRVVRPRDAIYHRTLFRLWRFRHGVCYLNHGSFGAVPLAIQRAQRNWQERCMAEPMDVLARETEPAWRRSRNALAAWLGAPPECLALSENATEAMNEIASWFPLEPGEEVLLTDHEYGAVKRIWERRATQSSAVTRYVSLPMPFDEPAKIVDAILSACTERTRIVVFSHITSPTAVILPVAEICTRLRQRNIASCVDGPHALLQERVHLEELDCDFYTASCHKWLCAPLGSGFVYVHPRWTKQIVPMRLSWGLLPPGRPTHWTDELTWIGTRDYSPYMAIPAAINFFSRFDLRRLDERNYALACYARRVLSEMMRSPPLTPESRQWMGWMTAVWLPPGDHSQLQQRLWERYRIEVPIMHFGQRSLVRVSCHLYNTTRDIDRLARALQSELASAPSPA